MIKRHVREVTHITYEDGMDWTCPMCAFRYTTYRGFDGTPQCPKDGSALEGRYIPVYSKSWGQKWEEPWPIDLGLSPVQG